MRDKILDQLLKDPTRSIQNIAKSLKTYRQKIWRHKKKLEDNNTIWGYTAVVDTTKSGHVTYLVMMKVRPMTKDFSDIIIRRLIRSEPKKQDVNLLNVLYVNGEYDWVIMFSAPDHTIARRYYDTLRMVYSDHLIEKPAIVDVNFALMREGKVNPEIERLYDFIPLR